MAANVLMAGVLSHITSLSPFKSDGTARWPFWAILGTIMGLLTAWFFS